MGVFEETAPALDSYWRAIILFGRNVASYKFALGQSLLDLGSRDKNFISMEDLADPFAKHIVRHLELAPKQATSSSSRFLDACRKFAEEAIPHEQLRAETVRLGFNNVIDAFHIVNQGEIPTRFFLDRRQDKTPRIELTDDFFRLKESMQYANLPGEVESRWRLVETAWELRLPSRMLLDYNPTTEMLLARGNLLRRNDITACRDALNGYQKGRCFYCFGDISIGRGSPDLADVDHFVPRVLISGLSGVNLDGVWNLVLACRNCNRGIKGKSARLPKVQLLERLHARNEYFIRSHHPLRETLIAQTGGDEDGRAEFLKAVFAEAMNRLIMTWAPTARGPAVF
jgi:hypothetical protein